MSQKLIDQKKKKKQFAVYFQVMKPHRTFNSKSVSLILFLDGCLLYGNNNDVNMKRQQYYFYYIVCCTARRGDFYWQLLMIEQITLFYYTKFI